MELEGRYLIDEVPVVFLLGLSGAGKTTLGGWLAEDMGFLWIEIDRLDGGNALDTEGLLAEWEMFAKFGQAGNLASALRARALGTRASGTVLTFPSTTIFHASHLAALEQARIRVLVMYGHRLDCLESFSRREQDSGRGLPESHWECYNADAMQQFGGQGYDRYRVMAFHDGRHRERGVLVAEVRDRVGASDPGF